MRLGAAIRMQMHNVGNATVALNVGRFLRWQRLRIRRNMKQQFNIMGRKNNNRKKKLQKYNWRSKHASHKTVRRRR